MQSLVKQLLTLTNTSAATQWQQVETAIQPKQLTPSEIAEVVQHLAVNQQGSELFWDTLQRAAVDQLGSFNRDQLAALFDGMMQSPYEVPEEVGVAISEAFDTFCVSELQAQQQKDPYFLANFLFQVQAALGQFAFRTGPGFVSGRFNDELPEPQLSKEDNDLSESSNSEITQAILDANEKLTQEQVDEKRKELWNEVQALFAKNQNAQDITNLK